MVFIINLHVFVNCEDYFLFFIDFLGFKKVNFLESQSMHVDFSCPILFPNATPFMLLLSAFFTN